MSDQPDEKFCDHRQLIVIGDLSCSRAIPVADPASGIVVACELADGLGMITLLDAAIGPIKARDRGFTGGQLLVELATAELAGEDFLVGLDRQRADVAGQVLAAYSWNRSQGLTADPRMRR
ncbi:MAG: hypothetical protein ABIZ05_14650 [Pseudonocardiaceae bacterium]